MSYGQNMPWGLQATKTLGSASYNGQSNPYLIQSGYANNILKGDPVIITASGYIQSLFDWAGNGAGGGGGANAYGLKSTIGVFVGCSFVTPTALNPIDPASPGRSFWPSGTQTLNGVPATAFVIDDPNVVYNVQTNASPGMIQANMGRTAQVVFNNVVPAGWNANQVYGNFNTGMSVVALSQASIAANDVLATLRLLRFVPISGNFSADAVFPQLGYNNAEVIIQNHAYCTRPAAYA